MHNKPFTLSSWLATLSNREPIPHVFTWINVNKIFVSLDLVGSGPIEAALCDEIADTTSDIPGPLFAIMFTQDKEKQVSLFIVSISTSQPILQSI